MVIILAILHSCTSKPIQKNSEGLAIAHAPSYYTTELPFQDFILHTYTNDTIYRNCGYELTIEPVDSTSSFELLAEGARIMRHSTNSYKFILEPQQFNLKLDIVVNEIDTVSQQFISPKLPKPEVLTEVRLDSVYLSIMQSNTRLKDLLQKDCRYQFEQDGKRTTELVLGKTDISQAQYSIIRSNYVNNRFQVNMEE